MTEATYVFAASPDPAVTGVPTPMFAKLDTPETVVLSVDAAGAIYWFDARLSGAQSLGEKLKAIAAQTPQPEVHIRGDARADFEAVARVLAAAQQAGIARIGFVTEEPDHGH